MEILKVGDELSISGYKSITLSDDMQSNVSKFAQVNGIQESEARQIMYASADLQDFIENLCLDDEEEDIIITDFNLDDDVIKTPVSKAAAVAETNSTKGTSKVTNVQAVSSTKAEASNNETGSGIVYADSSSNNPTDLKDILGIFGLSSSTNVTQTLYTGTKITGFILNSKRYEVSMGENGIVNTTITDENGQVTTGQYPPPDPFYAKLEKAKTDLYDLIEPLIRESYSYFPSSYQDKLKNAINQCLDEYDHTCTGVDNIIVYIGRYIGQSGLDKTEYDKVMEGLSTTRNKIKSICENLDQFANDKIQRDKEEEKYTNKTQTVDGVIFKIRYFTNSTNSCSITSSNGVITVDGKNCEVDVMGFGGNDKAIKITGSNVTFRSNAVTMSKITNESNNSNITGSFANDNILNKSNGSGTIINGNDGDDVIRNYGSDTKLNGDAGNDTIINYAKGITINGGDGDDSINYVSKSDVTIVPSSGNDTEHVIGGLVESDDSDYDYAKQYTAGGITFVAYSNDEDFSDLDISIYKKLVTVTASNMKINITGCTDPNTWALQLNGSDMKLNSNVRIKSLFNYADNSAITGSSGIDYIYNYADNTTVNANDGNDSLINEGDNVTLDGGKGADTVYNRDTAHNTTIKNDGSDTIYDKGSGTSAKLTKGSMTSQEYNRTVNNAYINAAYKGTSTPNASDASSSTISSARNLASKLVSSKGNFSELAQKIISYYQDLSNTDEDDMEILQRGLKSIDTSNDGNVTDAELKAFEEKIEQEEQDAERKQEQTQTLSSVTSSLISSLGVTSSQISTYISGMSTDEALSKLTQIQTIISTAKDLYSNSSSSTGLTKAINSIKQIITSGSCDFNNEILEDAQILIDSQSYADPQAYIKSQMIKDCTGKTDAQMLSEISVGDVGERDGVLYVNDSGKLVKLNISADTYLELFPPVERYFAEQHDYGDCFFIATALVEAMESDQARAKILEMFSENASGDVTVTFPGLSDYPVTFTNGNLKTASDTGLTGAKGLQMLEQAYALARFAKVSNSDMSVSSISSKYSKNMGSAISSLGSNRTSVTTSNISMDTASTFYDEGGYASEALEDLFGKNGAGTYGNQKTISSSTSTSNMATIMKDIAKSINSNSIVLTVIAESTSISSSDASQYNLVSGHQYAIESIDTTNQTVTIKNPHHAYETVTIPYSVFFKYFAEVITRTLS